MKKHTAAADLPTTEQIARERSRLRYKRRYGRTLRSTAAILLVVAALAVLVATLWMPVLRIYGSSMAPTLSDGQLVVAIKTETFAPGDITAFYYGNKLLIKRYIAGPADWVDIDADGIVSINGNVLDSCFSFQGKFFHFLAINRHREIEYNLLYPASVFSLFREHLNSLDKGFHKLFLFCFRCGMVDFIKCQ